MTAERDPNHFRRNHFADDLPIQAELVEESKSSVRSKRPRISPLNAVAIGMVGVVAAVLLGPWLWRLAVSGKKSEVAVSDSDDLAGHFAAPPVASVNSPKPPEPPPDPRLEDARRIWRTAASKEAWGANYRYAGSGKWTAVYASGAERSLKEISRDEEFIELVVPFAEIRVRLGADKLEMRRGEEPWILGETGGWEETESRLQHPTIAVFDRLSLLELNWRALATVGSFHSPYKPAVFQNSVWTTTGWLAGEGVGDRLEVPLWMDDNYTLDISFVRDAGEQGITFLLPCGQHKVEVALDAPTDQGYFAGLQKLDGRELPFDEKLTCRPDPLIRTLENHRVRFEVKPKQIISQLDGHPWFEWKGEKAAEESESDDNVLSESVSIGFATNASSYEFTRFEVAPLSPPPAGFSTPRIPLLAALGILPPSKASYPLQVGGIASRFEKVVVGEYLEEFSFHECRPTSGKSEPDGSWTLGGDALSGSLVFPASLPASYLLEVKLQRELGEMPVVFYLPIGDEHARLVLDAYPEDGMLSGLEAGVPLSGAHHRPVVGAKLPLNRMRSLRCRVSDNGLEAELDGEPIVNWHGDPRSLRKHYWADVCPGQLSFGVIQSKIRYAGIKVTDLEN